jgi:hypothetical protein
MVDRSHYFASAPNWPVDMLASWRWLIGAQTVRILRVTAMGSLFLMDAEGAVHFLDTTEGSFHRVADSQEAIEGLFDSSGNRKALLWSFFVRILRQHGMFLQPGQCYGWKIPPCMGGRPELENIEPSDVGVHVSMQGQIHEQVRRLQPGTSIDEVRVVEPQRSFWRRLFGRGPIA